VGRGGHTYTHPHPASNTATREGLQTDVMPHSLQYKTYIGTHLLHITHGHKHQYSIKRRPPDKRTVRLQSMLFVSTHIYCILHMDTGVNTGTRRGFQADVMLHSLPFIPYIHIYCTVYYTWTQASIQQQEEASVYKYIYIYMCVCVCVCIYIYIHM
jgi:hypothetical protein